MTQNTQPAPTFTCTPEIRWSDQDLLGHVNNAKVTTLIEEARIQWLNRFWGERDLRRRPLLVARMEIDYRRPVTYGPQLRIDLSISRVGTSSFTITCRGTQDGEVTFEGLNVMVVIDAETGRPSSLTDDERSVLQVTSSE